MSSQPPSRITVRAWRVMARPPVRFIVSRPLDVEGRDEAERGQVECIDVGHNLGSGTGVREAATAWWRKCPACGCTAARRRERCTRAVVGSAYRASCVVVGPEKAAESQRAWVVCRPGEVEALVHEQERGIGGTAIGDHLVPQERRPA